MTKTLHTPAPWRIRENARHSQDQCDLTICGDIFQLADINGPQYAHQIANANLMAAAPDMLEALDELYAKTIIGTDDERHAALDKAWAAIAKATGQQVSA